MDARVPHSFGSATLLLGAFAVGWVLHQTVVRRALSPTSPVAVLVALCGVGLILAGRAMERRFDPSAFVPDSGDDDGEFDERLSPLDGELEGRERDEPREPRG